MNNYYMKQALKEANKALKKGDVPIGAIIVKNNKIISRAYNQVEKKHNSILHAELIAIKKASKKIKNWRLNECILYTTMEPCMMCSGAIINSRISKVVYGTQNNNHGCINIINKGINISQEMPNECTKIVQEFFKKRR